MGINEIKDLVYDVYCEFINEMNDVEYKGRLLTPKDAELLIYFLELFTDKVNIKLDDKIDNIKQDIQSLEVYMNNCAYGKKELQELAVLKNKLLMLESEE